MKKIVLSLLLFVDLNAKDAKHGEIETPLPKKTGVFPFKSEKKLSDKELKEKIIYTGVIATGAVMLWGTAFWDYSFTSPEIYNEGWFGKDTKYGGADKMGHVYCTYLWSVGFSYLYKEWGMSDESAMIYAPASSWIFQGMMEIGDSFGETMGFSYEDVVMNTVGAAFYYLREKYPSVKEKLDLRLEYVPEFKGDKNFFTQYNSMKYLMALKFSGFESMDSNLLKYGELQVGYYTRGYKDSSSYSRKERVAYVGIGINVSEVLSAIGWTKTSKIFNYYQAPYTYVPFGHDFDSGSYVAPYSRPYHGSKLP